MRFPFSQTWAVYNYMRKQKHMERKRFPLVLMLEPLHACNLFCSGCGRIREYRDYMSEMVPLDKCLAVADECGAPVVSICGGEPLLYPQIAELVNELLKRGRVVYLCTNGQILDKKLGEFTPHKRFNFNIHIDGLAATHDAIVEKKGAFDKAISGLVAAKKAGFNVCTNTTVYEKTDADEVKALFDYLDSLKVDGILLSPSYEYSDVEDKSVFMDRKAIADKFIQLKDVFWHKRMWNTPLFMEFLTGKRDYPCTPWGSITYNVCGWKAPCYLATDRHYENFDEFMSNVDWDKYGHGKDARCEKCMMHSGFEPTVALTTQQSICDTIKMAYWTLF